MSTYPPVQAESKSNWTPKAAFLAGLATGFAACLILGVALLVASLGSILRSAALDDLADYRTATTRAQVDETQKQTVLHQIDLLTARVQQRGVGFLEYADFPAELDAIVKDCELTLEEWPRFVEGLNRSAVALGVDSQGSPAKR